MATQRVHDVIVIGGGSAGYAAGRTAREAGADVAIVDRGPLGGLCILRGCMPTKTILRSAEIAALMRRAPEFGLAPVDVRAALSAIVDRKDRLVREFADYRIQQLRDPGYTLYEAPASFLSPHLLQVGNDRLTAKAFIIATGSVPRQDVIPDVTLEACVTSDTLLERRDQPESLIVLGAGPVGLEFAQFFARIGTAVTIVQRSAHVLSHLDAESEPPSEPRWRRKGSRSCAARNCVGSAPTGESRWCGCRAREQSRRCPESWCSMRWGASPISPG